MEKWLKSVIEEHAQLVKKISKLHHFIHFEDWSAKVCVEDFANMCIQLKAMKVYAEALEARLSNNGIQFSPNGEYYEKVAEIEDDDKKEDNSDND